MKTYECPQFKIVGLEVEEAVAVGIETETSIPDKWE